ncbi:MAG: AIR synthase related protein [Thermoproteaceae archaeon]|nr:AIR synthase related protein [Thermoproteaceae archaeon]
MGEKAFLRDLLSSLGAEDNDVTYIDGIAVKIDGISASASRLAFQSWQDFGWRGVAAAYSDMRVKYATPTHMLASVTAPSLSEASEVIEGILEAASCFGVKYIGGDLNRGGDVVVDIVMVGRAERRVGRIPRPGDILITIPEFGYTSIAYRFWRESGRSAVVRRGVEMLRRPKPTWPLPPAHCVTASMDSSDGLADVLWTMARGVDVIVTRLPTSDELVEFARERGLDVDELVFNGGEELLPVFAVRRDCDVTEPYIAFAEVVSGSGAVWWREGTLRWRGWDYFSGTGSFPAPL